jgi:hypothetical protein
VVVKPEAEIATVVEPVGYKGHRALFDIASVVRFNCSFTLLGELTPLSSRECTVNTPDTWAREHEQQEHKTV